MFCFCWDAFSANLPVSMQRRMFAPKVGVGLVSRGDLLHLTSAIGCGRVILGVVL
jgi:hypothetical protein